MAGCAWALQLHMLSAQFIMLIISDAPEVGQNLVNILTHTLHYRNLCWIHWAMQFFAVAASHTHICAESL